MAQQTSYTAGFKLKVVKCEREVWRSERATQLALS